MRRILPLLDSRPLSRASAVATIVSLVTAGIALVALMYAQGADLVREGQSITVICFGVWSVLSVLLIVAWAARRKPGIITSPAARIAIAKGLPGSPGALLTALTRAEASGREFIAEAAILMPVNNQKAAYDLAQGYAKFESEIGTLIESADAFDERWSLTWNRRPSWYEDYLLTGPFTLGVLNELVRYIAHRNRQIGWMIDFVQTGNDEHVRHAKAWARYEKRKADESRAAWPSKIRRTEKTETSPAGTSRFAPG